MCNLTVGDDYSLEFKKKCFEEFLEEENSRSSDVLSNENAQILP